MFSLLKVHGKRTVDIDEQIHSSTHRQYPKMHDLRDFIHQIYLCWFYSAVLACRLYCIYCQYNRRLPRDTGKSILHKTYIIPFHSHTHTREFYSRDLFFFCVFSALSAQPFAFTLCRAVDIAVAVVRLRPSIVYTVCTALAPKTCTHTHRLKHEIPSVARLARCSFNTHSQRFYTCIFPFTFA